MALAAGTVLDVRNGGSDTANGGGFNLANANFPTDLTTDANTGNTASPVVSSASYNFVAGDVGAWLYVKSGTNWIPGLYQIASVASNKATLSAGIGAAYLVVNNSISGRNTAAGVATVGTPTSGTFGIDYSQQNAAQITFTDMSIGGAGATFTSAGNPVGKNFVGNLIQVTGGTNATTGHYEVVSTSGTTATLDRNWTTGACSNGAGGLGGGLATPGKAGSIKVAGMDVALNYNASDYTLTNTTANTAAGPVSDTTGGVDTTNHSYWFGYDTNRHRWNTDANRPTINAGTQVSFTMFNVTGDFTHVHNIICNGNSKTGTKGFSITSTNAAQIWRCSGNNCLNSGVVIAGVTNAVFCSATGCSTAAAFLSNAAAAHFYFCEAYGNTITGFDVNSSGNGLAYRCLSYNNSGASSDGFTASSTAPYRCVSCVSQGNGRHGFNLSAGFVRHSLFVNCVATDNGGEGWSSAAAKDGVALIFCAGRNNTSGNYSTTNFTATLGFITLTADPFTNTATGDFSLNNTAGGGALLRGLGYPSTFPRGTTANYVDPGAAQHQDAGGAGASGGRRNMLGVFKV